MSVMLAITIYKRYIYIFISPSPVDLIHTCRIYAKATTTESTLELIALFPSSLAIIKRDSNTCEFTEREVIFVEYKVLEKP